MKTLKFDVGGRPRANDDLETLQDEMYAALQATLQGAPPMVLSGCELTRNGSTNTGSIGAGMIWLAGSVHRFIGAANVTLPAEIAPGVAVDSDFRAYQTGGSKACMTELELLVQPKGTAPVGTALTFGFNKAENTYWQYVQLKTRTVTEVQWLAMHNADLYDTTGKGWEDNVARGWALCNGQNGTADLQERFVAGMNPDRTGYAIGETGGAESVQLTANQNGQHNHIATTGQFGYSQLLRKAPLGSNTTAASTDGNGNGGNEPDITTSQTMASSGLGEAHENRPPFYVLCARQWIGF